MSKPYVHAESSAKVFGGVPEDYLEIHNFIDSSKAYIADSRHRALLHNTFGCFLVEKVFGCVAKNSAGVQYSPRDVAERHCIEDLGVIPTVQDWLSRMPIVEDSEIRKASVSGSSLDEYKKTKAQSLSVLAKAAEEYSQVLAEGFSKLPKEIGSVVWTQGTPSFNDGEPCEFGVHDFYAHKEKPVDEDDEYGEMLIMSSNPNKYQLDIAKRHNTEWAIVGIDADEELLRCSFGDGVKVTWNRSDGKFEIECYSMD